MVFMKVQALSELKQVRKAMAERQAIARAERLREQAALQQALEASQHDRLLFERTVGPVQAMVIPDPVHDRLPRPLPVPQQRQRDEQSVMREALSDEFDAETLLHTDEHLSYRCTGVGTDVVRKLRQGQWRLQAELDLHGLRTDEAREQLVDFVREACRQGLRCVRIVHGKGLGSPGKTPVLKSRVHSWLAQKTEVMAFVQARPADGGAGALVVLLKPSVAGPG